MSEYTKTPPFRAAFANVITPKQPKTEGKKPRFELVALFDADADLTGLKKAAKAAIEEKWPDEKKRPKNLKSPFRDQGDQEYEGFKEGNIYVNMWSYEKPAVVGSEKVDGKFIHLDEDEFYSGCFAHAKVKPFCYDVDGNRGVAFYMGNIQKIKDGERLGGGRANPEDDFEAAESEAGSSDDDDLFG